MFRFGEFKVVFKHVQIPRKTILEMNAAGYGHSAFAEKTVCTIWLDGQEKDVSPVSVGIAMCSLKDEFKKSKGREIAFARAMHQISSSKEDRLEWWKAFWTSYDGRFTNGAAVAYLHDIIDLELLP